MVLEDIQNNSAVSTDAKAQASHRVKRIIEANSWDEVYGILNISYYCENSGIPRFPDETFEFIYSVDVLEHVHRDRFDELASIWYKLSKPGGLFAAQVGLDDHIQHYSKNRHPKYYLSFSDRVFKNVISSDIQYINRLTASEVIASLKKVGYIIERVEREYCDVSNLRIHSDYANQSLEDLKTTRLKLVARK